MARRKVFHGNKISYLGSRSISSRNVKFGDMIEFKYSGQDIYDSKPIVFVLEKSGDLIKGINLNYLTEYRVQQLLQEVNHKKMQWYELYHDSIRSYKMVKMKLIKKVKYKRDIDAT
tara:strand:+ start:102 stop:449 length:348 start_codon:yes stop_codon:yes gene_type:complete